MHDIFSNKDSWLAFAQKHNAGANPDATLLNGSQSYTTAAIHLAAGIAVPPSLLLDTKRAEGIFVSDHFAGLRDLYKTGSSTKNWLHDIIAKAKKFALENRIDQDDLIVKLCELTEKGSGHGDRSHNLSNKPADNSEKTAFKQELRALLMPAAAS